MENQVIYEGKFQYRISSCLIVLIGALAIPAGIIQLFLLAISSDGSSFDPISKLGTVLFFGMPVLLVLLGIALHARQFMKRKLLLLPDAILWIVPNRQPAEMLFPLHTVQEIYASGERTLMITADGMQYAVDGLADAYAFEQAVHSRVRAQNQIQEQAAAAADVNPAAVFLAPTAQPVQGVQPVPEIKPVQAILPIPEVKPLPEVQPEPAGENAVPQPEEASE